QLGSRGLAVGGEAVAAYAVHEFVLVGVDHSVIEPVALGHVDEGLGGRRLLHLDEGGGDGHLAVGHGEGVGAVRILGHPHGVAETVGDGEGGQGVALVRNGRQGHRGPGLGSGGVGSDGAVLHGTDGDLVVGVGGGRVGPDGGEGGVGGNGDF